MEAWQVTHYRAPHLVPFSAHLADDGQTVVLAADAKEYEIQFSGVDGGRVLDSVLAMANPDAEIWFDIHAGSAPSWQLSLAQQLDALSLIRDAPADPAALERQRRQWSALTRRCVDKLLAATAADARGAYAPVVLSMLRLLDEPAPQADAFCIDDAGAPEWRDNFALQTFYLQKLYLADNLPQALTLWRRVLNGFADGAGFVGLSRREAGTEEDPASEGFYCPAHLEAYLLCLTDLLLLAPKPQARRRLVHREPASAVDSGVNFMRRAEQFALDGLAELGESRYVSRVNAADAGFGPLVQGLFIEQYHVTQRFVEIIAPLMTKRLCSPLKQRVYRYFQEELGHEVYERATCEALGVPPAWLDQALPLPLFQAYVDAFTVLGRYDPIGYLSSIMVTEGMLGVDNPVHERLESLVEFRADYQRVAKRHDDLNLELNHAALSRLFFREISALSPLTQQRALSNLAYLLELNLRAMDQVADFYGPQAQLAVCSLDRYAAAG
ncbi:hypothetical protein HNO92_003928 [Chromobacterium alkanivorans]|uniref:hypothetical protein n=1 Tax=Chromobacterium alkanivorans TaxID=1071719 RepID=UPI002167532F|nr:hypothetical protein [Chromobacterium alkanivorans]MCS3803936.1 hypothetical protein [Chromobacterium alkanivorans]MCS3817959.1 hypothetical protein [Chromobacterium alkanivorans]MCS3875579.1 hypothetical protein [Chromobacterium alkanivorans]